MAGHTATARMVKARASDGQVKYVFSEIAHKYHGHTATQKIQKITILALTTDLGEIYSSAYAPASCLSSSKRTGSTGSGDLHRLVSELHHNTHVPENPTFSMGMLRCNMPVEPLLPRKCCKWIQTLCSGERVSDDTYTHCTLPTCIRNAQELWSASPANLRSDREVKQSCDLRPWKYAEQGRCSVVAMDWKESGLGRRLSVRTGSRTVL